MTVTGGWDERLWFGGRWGTPLKPLRMRVFLLRSGVNVPSETTATPSPRTTQVCCASTDGSVAAGSIMIARQKIQVGIGHAGRTLAVDEADTTFRVYNGD